MRPPELEEVMPKPVALVFARTKSPRSLCSMCQGTTKKHGVRFMADHSKGVKTTLHRLDFKPYTGPLVPFHYWICEKCVTAMANALDPQKEKK